MTSKTFVRATRGRPTQGLLYVCALKILKSMYHTTQKNYVKTTNSSVHVRNSTSQKKNVWDPFARMKPLLPTAWDDSFFFTFSQLFLFFFFFSDFHTWFQYKQSCICRVFHTYAQTNPTPLLTLSSLNDTHVYTTVKGAHRSPLFFFFWLRAPRLTNWLFVLSHPGPGTFFFLEPSTVRRACQHHTRYTVGAYTPFIFPYWYWFLEEHWTPHAP